MTAPPPPPAVRAASLVRLPLQYLGFWCLLAFALLLIADLVGLLEVPGALTLGLVVAGVTLTGVAALLTSLSPLDRRPPLVVGPPVSGRWETMNSPGTKVPSHGSHAYGQAYAVDLVHAPEDRERPLFGKTESEFLPPDRFPAFGQPILAAADGTVVRAHDGQRDHRSRSGFGALLYLATVEAVVRSLGSPSRVVGNHLVLRLEDGTHLLYAHLQRGSQLVRVGDRVVAGQRIATCGNSGNTTEPHLHVQRQDTASVLTASGLPWGIRGEAGDGIPADGGVVGAAL